MQLISKGYELWSPISKRNATYNPQNHPQNQAHTLVNRANWEKMKVMQDNSAVESMSVHPKAASDVTSAIQRNRMSNLVG
jgi:hypothetical protein